MTHDTQRADVLIIGAGPTGAVAAKRLAEAGLKVVVLEQGDWPDNAKARADHPDFELRSARDWALNPNVRRAPADYPINDEDSDIAATVYNAVGGTSLLYAAHWQRSMPSDFRVQTLDGVADDWPLTYEDLVPYYDEVEKDFGVSGVAGDPAFPLGNAPPLSPFPLDSIGRLIAKGHNKLGWHWWPGANAIATQPYRSLQACTARGTCMQGCVEGAKASVDRTHWPHNISLGVRLITGARARRLEVNRNGLVTGASYVDRNGRDNFQAADVTILGANGIGTPRLLLLSESDRFPHGLANSSGLVGKRLMLHPFASVAGFFDEDLGTTQGIWGQQLTCLEFYETDVKRGFVRGAKWGLMPTGGPLSVTRTFQWSDDDPIWGEGFHDSIRKGLGRSAAWGIISEDLPDENNCVVLDPDLKDSDGIPAPKILYRLSDGSRRLLDFHIARAKESMQAAGAYKAVEVPRNRDTGWHILGTCKMGVDPATSVVDEWGRAHDISNLYIFDGSIWPTSSGMNPTATIAAMALRCADRLAQQHFDQKVPG